jgi:hypothetical protein
MEKIMYDHLKFRKHFSLKTDVGSKSITNPTKIDENFVLQCVSGFSKAKSANGGSILSSSQFLILPQLPQKIKIASKVVKVDSKIIISLPKI